MDGIFGRKKMKMPSSPKIECDYYSGQIKSEFKELEKIINSEENEKYNSVKKSSNKKESENQYYCHNCGKEYNSLIDICEECGKDMEYKKRSENNKIIILTKETLKENNKKEYIFFSPGTSEYFAYNAAQSMIKLYDLSLQKSKYLEIIKELSSLRSSMNMMNNPLGIINSLEEILKNFNISFDNFSLMKKASKEFSEKILAISKNIINSFNNYLAINLQKNASYQKVIDYINDKKID
jgi:hypothetical protein